MTLCVCVVFFALKGKPCTPYKTTQSLINPHLSFSPITWSFTLSLLVLKSRISSLLIPPFLILIVRWLHFSIGSSSCAWRNLQCEWSIYLPPISPWIKALTIDCFYFSDQEVKMEEAMSHTGIHQFFLSLQWLFFLLTPAWAESPHSH